ncbi:hypothetical protein [Nonomuraea sp. GTA35]|uniref:hypothetical protein n=1 Tax=Nonomuraea sp. GTA35 TaxID=1676746 RepID=UPI0035BF6803
MTRWMAVCLLAHSGKPLVGGGAARFDRDDLAEPAVLLGFCQAVLEVGPDALQAGHFSWSGRSCGQRMAGLCCSLLRQDPGRRHRIVDIRNNLLARIAEAERENWLGEVEGLKVGLARAEQKLAQFDQRARRAVTVNLGIPTFRDVAGRTVSANPNKIID